MKTALCMAAAGLLMSLLVGTAGAAGVPLMAPAPALAAGDPSLQLQDTKQRDFVKLHPINVNKTAFGANVLIVTLEGKDYSFAGSIRPAYPAPAKGRDRIDSLIWSGTESGGGTLLLSKDPSGGLLGIMRLPPSREFHLAAARGGSPVLVEKDGNVAERLTYFAPGVPSGLHQGAAK